MNNNLTTIYNFFLFGPIYSHLLLNSVNQNDNQFLHHFTIRKSLYCVVFIGIFHCPYIFLNTKLGVTIIIIFYNPEKTKLTLLWASDLDPLRPSPINLSPLTDDAMRLVSSVLVFVLSDCQNDMPLVITISSKVLSFYMLHVYL